ncbi:uncharacterized protein DSM5745_09532 [Aspergillus mulundensis]|uniref:Uncharacterized protein n=1 Tax=Aspergillus mulundensis TaxID=1810919 RepID=A0A3D8QVA7_9EURO|nr:hypothetical protein DSM5745_09532 [Aspergillus mulundensis]RDW65793.1 hypothetical protein DSM5745_09532 [Aspergillus mulundensis]
MNNYTYANPPYEAEYGRRFNLDVLPHHPVDWRFLKTKKLAHFGRAHKADYKRWYDYYFWGFDINLGFARVAEYDFAIQKLMYYTAEHHRPESFQEFDACTRDAGPRLLDFTRIPIDQNTRLWYLPISRNFPDLPSGFHRTGDEFLRPAQAPKLWTDLYVEQALYPSDPKFHVHTAVKNYFAYAAKLAGESDLPGWERDQVREAVQRAMIKIAYSGLERHPSAASRDPPRRILASSPEDLLQTVIRPISAISEARVSEDDDGRLSLDRSGQLCAVKGRGPIYSEDSDVMDCVITVGKLLDAGSTNLDRKDPIWYTQTSQLQRAFVELCDVNWDMCTEGTGADLKEQFRNMILAEMGNFEGDNPAAIRPIWDAVSKGLGQFMINYADHACSCDCIKNLVREGAGCHNSVPLLEDARDWEGVTMQELFDRTFDAVRTEPCEKCFKEDAVRLQRSFLKLPPRLVVTVPLGVMILGHTEDVTVKYRRAGAVSQDESAVYRWLGGIYHDGGSCRVFWDFAKPGEASTYQVGMYESSNYGLIVEGSLGREHDGCKVPPKWWCKGDIPLLFYERVMNPSSDVLAEAVHTVSNMWLEEGRGVLTLQNHKPWATTSDLPQSARDYPWMRDEIVKPPDAQHFQLAPDGYIPPEMEESSSEGIQSPETKRSAPKRPHPPAHAEDKESSKKTKQDQPAPDSHAAAPGEAAEATDRGRMPPSSPQFIRYPLRRYSSRMDICVSDRARTRSVSSHRQGGRLSTITEERLAGRTSGLGASGPTEPKPEAQKPTPADNSVPPKPTFPVYQNRSVQMEAGLERDDRRQETKDSREHTAQNAARPSRPNLAAMIKGGLSADDPREKHTAHDALGPPKYDLAAMIKGGLSADESREKRTAPDAAGPPKHDIATMIKGGLSADKRREKGNVHDIAGPPKHDLAAMINGGLSADGPTGSELETAKRHAEKEERQRRKERQREREDSSEDKHREMESELEAAERHAEKERRRRKGRQREKESSSKNRHREKEDSSRDRYRGRDSGSREKLKRERRGREKTKEDRGRGSRE